MAPTGVYHRLKAYVTGTKDVLKIEPVAPTISPTTAVSLLILYTLIYVLPFYISSATRPSPNTSRDAPAVIRGRIRSVTLSCIMCSISTMLILTKKTHDLPISIPAALHQMGYYPLGVFEALRSLGLTTLLFLGPLFEACIVDGGWKGWIRLQGFQEVLGGWIGYRNLIAGPVTEEVLFRSCAVPLLLMSRMSTSTIVFLTPFIFGLAHVHHFYEYRITHPHTPVWGAVIRSVFQLSYTTLFGGYATFVFMRTGSLISVILLHTFCNWMGLPRFWGRLSGTDTIIGPDIGKSKKSEDDGKVNNAALGIHWTVAYYVLLLLGAVGWYKLLWLWTESKNGVASFG